MCRKDIIMEVDHCIWSYVVLVKWIGKVSCFFNWNSDRNSWLIPRWSSCFSPILFLDKFWWPQNSSGILQEFLTSLRSRKSSWLFLISVKKRDSNRNRNTPLHLIVEEKWFFQLKFQSEFLKDFKVICFFPKWFFEEF